MKKKVSAKNGLESYAYQIRNACDDPKMSGVLKEEDKKKITDKVDEIIKWVDENPSAETEEYEGKQKELEEIWKPIMMAAYQATGGAPGGPGAPAGPPGGEASGPGGESGPKIDEVD